VFLRRLSHNSDEALPAHQSRLPLLHISALLGFLEGLGMIQATFKLKYLHFMPDDRFIKF
jgi:hypothetical protein